MTTELIKAINDAMSLLSIAKEEIIFRTPNPRDVSRAFKFQADELKKAQVDILIIEHFEDLAKSIIEEATDAWYNRNYTA